MIIYVHNIKLHFVVEKKVFAMHDAVIMKGFNCQELCIMYCN